MSIVCLRTLLNYNRLKQRQQKKTFHLRLRTLHFCYCLKPQIISKALVSALASPYGSQTYRRLQCRVPSIRVPHWHCKFLWLETISILSFLLGFV